MGGVSGVGCAGVGRARGWACEEKEYVVDVSRWAAQSAMSDPGVHASVLEALPVDVERLCGVLRGVVTHYRAGGVVGVGERWEEIDARWVESMLALDQARDRRPWGVGERVPLVGCCRDFALLGVAALRARGVPARTRVGFASYLERGFGVDHVLIEYWDGKRWVWVDPMLDPGGGWGFDVVDVPHGAGVGRDVFSSAARVWSAYRAGEVDAGRFGVSGALAPMLAGGWLVRDYVWLELAHRQGVETLLWDGWGAMGAQGDSALTDVVAGLLVAADEGDVGAEEELAAWFVDDERLGPRGWVFCASPSGYRGWVDVDSRMVEPAV